MNKITFAVIAIAICAGSAHARSFQISADRMAVDAVTKAAAATGHVVAVSMPLQLHSESATRDAEGVVRLSDPTEITTCTNRPGICHWSLKGEVEYQDEKYIRGRNLWLEFYEVPVFWVPYFNYPLEGECGLRVMPGYTQRWGAYLMLKYVYEIAGDETHNPDNFWMYGNTRMDLRYVNGIALGDTVNWNLARFGRGAFKIYYAWDEDADRYEHYWSDSRHWNYRNWGSNVNRDRYQMELYHLWEPTERDVVRLRGALASDSQMSDFFHSSFMTIRNEWFGNNDNEIAWEHNENAFGSGISVSGPLNEFYGGIARLPEWYFDLAPSKVFDLPLNYETENRVGYLARRYAEYGDGDETNPYAFNPGRWAKYATFRFDTYHRFTAPFKVDDIISVVPRLAYRGTFWNDGGNTGLTGWDTAGKHNGEMFRSILESGVTFSGRGRAWLSEVWRHVLEPYVDVLAQKAWYSGVSGDKRPYVFDSLDASVDWQDQFAGRSRNLPYTYYGVTPGVRNSFDKVDDKGNLHTLFDVDVYAAFQFNHADWYGTDDNHKLAQPGSPNYGKNDIYMTPGAQLRWHPDQDITLRTRMEYDPDYNEIAFADIGWRQRCSEDFSYFVNLISCDYRRWDFSSTPYDPKQMTGDDFNRSMCSLVSAGFEQHPIDWFAWSPFVRWDCRNGELDTVGAWFDYLTDCLGFRLVVEYNNSYTRIDGSEHEEDWDIGFFIYLRALGPEATDISKF